MMKIHSRKISRYREPTGERNGKTFKIQNRTPNTQLKQTLMKYKSSRLLPFALVILAALLPVGAKADIFDIADGDVASPLGLIAAINAANTSLGADTINLAPCGTYTLSQTVPPDAAGLPRITS